MFTEGMERLRETKLSSALRQDTQQQQTEVNAVESAQPSVKHTPQSVGKARTFKIIVLGESGVGKTCLSFRFCAGRFPVHSEATIGLDFREKVVSIEGERCKLQLWDTAGQERFRRSITHHYYRAVDAVVFVYDVNSARSLELLQGWLEEVEEHDIPPTVPRVLVGNKVDQSTQVNLHFSLKRYLLCVVVSAGGDDQHGPAVGGRPLHAVVRDQREGRQPCRSC